MSVQNLNAGSFFATLNVISVKFCLMVVLVELYPFIPSHSMTLTLQGRSSVKQFETESCINLSITAYPVEFRLCVVVIKYMD